MLLLELRIIADSDLGWRSPQGTTVESVLLGTTRYGAVKLYTAYFLGLARSASGRAAERMRRVKVKVYIFGFCRRKRPLEMTRSIQ